MKKDRIIKKIIIFTILTALSVAIAASAVSCNNSEVPVNTEGSSASSGGSYIIVTPVLTNKSESTPEPSGGNTGSDIEPTLTGSFTPGEQSTSNPSPTEHTVSLQIDPNLLYSRNMLLRDIDTGDVLYSLSPDEKIYPASLTKIMTALLAAELLPDDKDYTITAEVMDLADSYGASTSGFSRGETTDKNGIIAGILMASGADCSFTAAIEIAGGEQGFVELMNKKAQELGLVNTHFVTCTGLHNDDHYTTVSDLEKLTEYAIRNELFAYFFGLGTYAAKVVPAHQYNFNIVSTVFSGLESFDLGSVEVKGGKTGYTRQAGLCLVTYATYNGHRYILVTAGNDGNTKTEKYHFIDAQTIYGALQKEV